MAGNTTPIEETTRKSSGFSRRQFLSGAALLGAGALAGGAAANAFDANETTAAERIAPSKGYLLVDTKKCAGCRTCMAACSLAHYGVASLSLARIQIRANPLGSFPADTAQSQCHQCPYPSCVEACPVGAMHVDRETGVRTVEDAKCIGCERCINACPYTPSRVQWNPVDRHAQKCDLCLDAPYWNHQGGPEGMRACEEACPMEAIQFTNQMPVQTDYGYDVNLRNEHYLSLGFPIDDGGAQIPAETYAARRMYAAATAAGMTVVES